MNVTQFERLLYEGESTTLDFKEGQYRFAKATEQDKSELLKDILGFANASRRSDAFILIGVREMRGGRSEVVGIPESEHLADHSLQQFVNNLTNHPIRFHYEAFGFRGKQIGIIRIEQQTGPRYLKMAYAGLKKGEVYVRRGSSTDPTKPAGPDEIALMGHASGPQSAELVVEFAEVDRDTSLGARIAWDCEFCEMPPAASIPDLRNTPRSVSGIGINVLAFIDPFNHANKDYYRELAEFEFARRLFRPVRLCVRNIGQVAAASVRAELIVPISVNATLLQELDMPDPPRSHRNLYRVSIPTFPSAFRHAPGDLSINKNDDRFLIEIDCGDLQPGRQVRSDVFFIGKGTGGEIPLSGRLFSDNLPMPKDISLTINIEVSRTRLSVDELIRLPMMESRD